MSQVIPVDLIKTGGRLIPPGEPIPPPPAPPPNKPEPPPAASSSPPQTPAVSTPCPHCGLHPDVPPATVTPDEVARFVAAVLSDTAYTKDYPLFGGAVSVRFRSLTLDEAEAVQAEMMKLEGTGTFPPTLTGSAERFEAGIARYSALSVEKLTIGGVGRLRPADQTVADAVAWLRAQLKLEPVANALRQAYITFAGVLGAIQRHSQDPSFFSATAASGVSSASPPPASRP